MKIRITEERPGELREKAEEAVQAIEKITNRDLLNKAASPIHKPAPAKYPSVRGAVTRKRSEVYRIKRLMNEKIAKVLDAARG